MGLGSNGILKISLWLQAGSLLVLTSLLANTYAWIGAALTGVGLCFVIIGIGAAYKKSLGYLYCYAILVGMWMLLAALHVMTVLNMVTTPEELMDPVLILGQKIVDDETDPLKTVVPILYGVQGVAWCSSLICVMYLRLDDPTLGFEIQDPEMKPGVHTLDIRQSTEGKKWSTRMSQRFFSIGQSTIAPLDYNETTAKHGQEKGDEMTMHLEQQDEFQPPSYKTQEPQAAWTRDERRGSNDSDSTYIPKAHPIPQVVVTFGDDKTHDHPWSQLQQPTDLKSAMVKADEIEVRNTFVNDSSYDLGSILFDKPGESLSDIIFKVVQPLHMGVAHKETDKASTVKDLAGRISNDSETTDGDTKAESPSLSAVTTLNDYMIPDHECGDELQSRDVTVTPETRIVFSRDQSDDIAQCQRQNQRQYRNEFEKCENIRTFSPIKNASQPIVPERRSSASYGQESYSDMEAASHGHYSRSGYSDVTPRVQPNSSDSPHSTNVDDQYQNYDFSAYDQDYEQSSPATKSKPSLSSLQYWKNRNGRGSNNTNESTPSSPSPTSAAFNLANNITKKKKPTPVSPPEPKTPTLTVPTIVLHPDDEDNEPVRVLSDMDIEYLSTMPPAPLRPLAQEWDEFDEDDYYDDDGNDGYDYDDYHPRYAYTHEDEDIGEEEEEEETQFQMPKITNVEGEYDPYALDVPINLEIDLQGLEQGDIISSY